jgi:hypothetical protein
MVSVVIVLQKVALYDFHPDTGIDLSLVMTETSES